MKILNLYAGIGGNRKLWGKDHTITSVEIDQKIVAIYQDFFPEDTVVVADAHKYLLEHFSEFDFIWSSPPCPTHTRIRTSRLLLPAYPDMKLYEEIIFLKHFFDGKWVVENVISYYDPLIPPQVLAQHYFWSNFLMRPKSSRTRMHNGTIDELQRFKGFDLSKYSGIDKRKILRNCVEPETALHIIEQAITPIRLQGDLFQP
jgi:DNA (cytosine-5)-methyltransferase 1